MNILEAEDMVKGLPDQVLFQYAQNPPPQIPQFLAISEVQRRQDMRQRFQARQGGNEPTVKDQILQGGIAGAGGPAPGGGEPPPMAPPGAAPPGAPMQQPMTGAPMPPMGMYQGGLTPGGIVRMQTGRTVPRNEFEYLNNLRSQAIRAGDLAAVERIEKSIQAALDQNRSVARERMIGNLLPDFSGVLPDQSLTERFKLDVPSRPSSSSAPQQPDVQRILAKPPYSRTAQENDLLRASGVQLERSVIPREGITVPYSDVIKRVIDPSGLTSFTGQILPESDRARIERPPAEAAVAPAPAAASLPANFDFTAASRAITGQIPPAAPIAVERPPNVSPGGIADVAVSENTNRNVPPQTGTPAAGSQSALSLQSLLSGLGSNERPAEVQAAIDLQRQQMEQGLPPPVDISQFIQSAQQRQKEAKDEARRMAIAGTLMNLGAGVMGGDPAAGLRQATQTAMSTLAEGRREASAEGRMAEQLQLQAAQQQRQSILDTMKFKSDAVNNIANIVSGEQKSTRSDKLQAAQIIATYQANRERIIADERVQLGRNANSAQAARSAALKVAGDYIAANPAALIKDGKQLTPEQVSQLTREFAMSLDPEAFGSASSSGGSSNQEVTFAEIRSRNQR